MPVDRPWADLLVHCDDPLLPYVAVMSAIESLHRMTREDRDLGGLIVRGSDHLTAYNVYAEAYRKCGYVGEVYGLPRHLFDESIERWADGRGVLVKSIEDAGLGMASVYRAVKLPLPAAMPLVTDAIERAFVDLLARIQPFDLVMDEQTAAGDDARRGLADALARGEARHAAVQRNREAIETVRECWRRSGGTTPGLSQAELAAWYAEGLRGVRSLQEYRAAALRLDADAFVPRDVRARLMALCGAVEIR